MQNGVLQNITQTQSLKFELVELYISTENSGKQKWNFPLNPDIQNKRVLFVDAYSIETMSVSPQGHAVVSVANFIKSYLTLYNTKMQLENIQQVPLPAINAFYVPGGTTPNSQERILINNATTDWNKSYITIGSTPGVGDFSYVFGVWYVDN